MADPIDTRRAALRGILGGDTDEELHDAPEITPEAKLEETLSAALNAAYAAGKRLVKSYILAGNVLVELKKTVIHGEWIPLLERHGLKARTAQDMMKRARLVAEKNTDIDGVYTIVELDEEIGLPARLARAPKPEIELAPSEAPAPEAPVHEEQSKRSDDDGPKYAVHSVFEEAETQPLEGMDEEEDDPKCAVNSVFEEAETQPLEGMGEEEDDPGSADGDVFELTGDAPSARLPAVNAKPATSPTLVRFYDLVSQLRGLPIDRPPRSGEVDDDRPRKKVIEAIEDYVGIRHGKATEGEWAILFLDVLEAMIELGERLKA